MKKNHQNIHDNVDPDDMDVVLVFTENVLEYLTIKSL